MFWGKCKITKISNSGEFQMENQMATSKVQTMDNNAHIPDLV